jgi:glutaryl-CoA dehydrogenase
MARGEVIGCFGLTEPDYGSNPSGMITVAREQADGSFVLDGAKMWITNGSQADVAVVWAKLVRHGETAVGDDKTIRGFLVPTDTPGFRARDQKGKLSLRASDTSELILRGRAPAGRRDPAQLGRPQEPAHVPHAGALRHLVGRARRRPRLLRGGASYAKTRVMFDRPIGGFQIQQVRLADMLTEITKGQLVSLHLGRCKDQGTFTPTMVSLAKRNNVNIATDVAREARRLLGGNGILAEYASMRHMANLESVYTYEGTHDVHSLILGQAITGLNAFK